jgi:hypothetical protein
MTEAGCAPVVYGRIPHSDAWWRAVPNTDRTWLTTMIHAAVQGGHELAVGPRFLQARAQQTLIGVARQAADLSASMHSDGTRELYCFVGWLGTGTPPTLPELTTNYRTWAGPNTTMDRHRLDRPSRAFCAISVSPGARAFYDHRRATGDLHHQALRALGNRLVGILRGCLKTRTVYNEHTAWAHRSQDHQAARLTSYGPGMSSPRAAARRAASPAASLFQSVSMRMPLLPRISIATPANLCSR